MNPVRHLRCKVFRLTQAEMAALGGIRQATLSRYENGHREVRLSAITKWRAEAKRRRLPWDDRWFFESGRAA